MSEPKKHHYVPRTYLKPFTENSFCYVGNIANLKQGYNVKIERTGLRGVCYEESFYKIRREYHDKTFKLEDYEEMYIEKEIFSNYYEQNYAAIRDRIISGASQSMNDVVFFCDFIVQLKLRNPFWLKTFYISQKETIIKKLQNNHDWS